MTTPTSPSSPLLGTPYLRSLSHPSSSSSTPTTTTRITPSLCSSLSQFKKLVNSSRSLDDAITTRLNRQTALSRNEGGGECDKVWNELRERWTERNQVLTYCDQVLSTTDTEGGKKRVEEYGLSAEKGQLGRGRSTEQEIKRNQLHMEFSTERIIRQRTLNLLFSRCPSINLDTTETTQDEAVRVPKAVGQDLDEDERRRMRGRDERGGVRWA
ncbi:hypothetical protein JCM16303_004117 [Sporobolomyces ruberrimus]